MPKYSKSSPEWQDIIAKHPLWFSSETMNFWHSTILWGTLTRADDGWLFLSLEDNYNKSERVYSVRWVGSQGMTTPSFQQTSDKKQALALLAGWREQVNQMFVLGHSKTEDAVADIHA
jgi:hypothetical protein